MKSGFVDVPEDYYHKCKNSGSMVKIEYCSRTYDEENLPIDKEALVYLPYDYADTDNNYNVCYLMHGGGGDCNEVFGGMEAGADLKNILDNMILKGDIEPLIVVTPSFYYKGTEEALTSTKEARLLTQNFHHELVNDLIPLVDRKFRTKAKREHRAFGGYSMGAEVTWNIFAHCLEHFKYFLPMSGDCWVVELQGGLKHPKETVNYLESAAGKSGRNDYKVFACVGDAGVAYEPMDTMITEMKNRIEYFTFGRNFSEGNMVYCVAKGGTHSYEYCYKYIYNALPQFFNEKM